MTASGPDSSAPRSSHRANAPLVGVVFVILAVACFSGLDAATKSVGVIPVALVMWCRFTFQAVSTAALLLPRRGWMLFATRHPWLQALRGLLMFLTSAFSFISLRFMPIGEFTAIVMLTPLLMTLVAATLFSEPVARLRWVLVVLSFIGALLVVKPGSDAFEWATLLPVLVLLLNTSFHLVTGRLVKREDVGTMHFFTGFVAASIATCALPFVILSIERWELWAGLGLVCLLSVTGHALLILGYAKADVSTLTPLLYLQVVFGTAVGWLVFDHIPDRRSLVGIAVIAASGAASTWLAARQWRSGARRRVGRHPS